MAVKLALLGAAYGLNFTGFYKLYGSENRVTKLFIDSRIFSCAKDTYCRDIYGRINLDHPRCPSCTLPTYCTRISENRVRLEHPECEGEKPKTFSRDKTYTPRTIFKSVWRGFYSTRSLYGISPRNVADAFLYRLSAAREESLLRHASLFQNQSIATTLPAYKLLIQELRDVVLSGRTDVMEYTAAYATDPTRPKFKLYSRTWDLIIQTGLIVSLIWMIGRDRISQALAIAKEGCSCKFKNEWAKFGKFGRNVVDLGTPAAIQCGACAQIFMGALKAVSVNHQDLWTYVADGSLLSMSVGARRVWETNCFHMMFKGDDGCVGIFTTDGIKVFDIDIKGADGSAGPTIFTTFLDTFSGTSWATLAYAAVKQCSCPITITNPYYNWIMEFTPTIPILYSGSVLTVIINNLGSLLICYHIQSQLINLGRYPTPAESEKLIIASAESAGYLVTMKPAPYPEIMQFLKYSFTSDQYLPFLNLAVIFRAIGSCDGLAPEHPLGAQYGMIERDSQVMTGFKWAGDHPVTAALRRQLVVSWARTPTPDVSLHTHYFTTVAINDVSRIISCESIKRRYNFSDDDIRILISMIDSMHLGITVNSPQVEAIFTMDYDNVDHPDHVE